MFITSARRASLTEVRNRKETESSLHLSLITLKRKRKKVAWKNKRNRRDRIDGKMGEAGGTREEEKIF